MCEKGHILSFGVPILRPGSRVLIAAYLTCGTILYDHDIKRGCISL